jgi:hypothetical protein
METKFSPGWFWKISKVKLSGEHRQEKFCILDPRSVGEAERAEHSPISSDSWGIFAHELFKAGARYVSSFNFFLNMILGIQY